MKKPEVAAVKKRSLAKGLIAGCIGGLAGTVARTFAERMFPPQAQGKLPAKSSAENPAGHALMPAARPATFDGIRWGLGVAAGAAYGAVVEYFPAATAKDGASFGIALGALTQQTPLPTLGVLTGKETSADEVTALVAYGVTTEFVRKLVRKLL